MSSFEKTLIFEDKELFSSPAIEAELNIIKNAEAKSNFFSMTFFILFLNNTFQAIKTRKLVFKCPNKLNLP